MLLNLILNNQNKVKEVTQDNPNCMLDIFEFYNQMERNKIMLSFKGDITSELLTSILQIMESKLDNIQEEPRSRKRFTMFLLNVYKIFIIIWMFLQMEMKRKLR